MFDMLTHVCARTDRFTPACVCTQKFPHSQEAAECEVTLAGWYSCFFGVFLLLPELAV